MGAFHDPDDEEYSKLAERAHDAWVNGIRKLEGKEFKIGEKLPGIFQKAGLSNIKAEVQADAWLYSDPRRRLSDVKAELRFDYSVFKERRRKDRKYLLAGGLSNATITSYFNRLEDRTEALMSDDEKLRRDASLYAATFFLGIWSEERIENCSRIRTRTRSSLRWLGHKKEWGWGLEWVEGYQSDLG
jgi:hypothetical protein